MRLTPPAKLFAAAARPHCPRLPDWQKQTTQMTNNNDQCPDPFICPIMQDGEPMQDPVIAADGHTYERSGIAKWLTNHTTSPVTRAVLRNQELTPNHLIKSQIEQWREDQKGVTARLKRLEALLAKIHLCGSRADALSALSAPSPTSPGSASSS